MCSSVWTILICAVKSLRQTSITRKWVACFDIRTGLYDAQIYAADWAVVAEIKNLLRTMNFSHEEAQAETPVSACGDTLGVADTVRLATTVCVMNFKRFLTTGKVKKSTMVTTDP